MLFEIFRMYLKEEEGKRKKIRKTKMPKKIKFLLYFVKLIFLIFILKEVRTFTDVVLFITNFYVR